MSTNDLNEEHEKALREFRDCSYHELDDQEAEFPKSRDEEFAPLAIVLALITLAGYFVFNSLYSF